MDTKITKPLSTTRLASVQTVYYPTLHLTSTQIFHPTHLKSVQLPPLPSHSTPYPSQYNFPPYPSTPPPTLPLHPLPSHSTPYPPTSHLTAGVDFFSFDLASAGLNEGIILGPRTLCLIPGGPASGGGSEPLPPSGRRMLQERNQ